jgi:hypothetical protein
MTASPSKPTMVAVKITSGASGEKVRITNVTQGWSVSTSYDSNGSAVVVPSDLGYSLATGDSIIVEVSGTTKYSSGTSTATTSSGGATISLTLAADTTSQPIDF